MKLRSRSRITRLAVPALFFGIFVAGSTFAAKDPSLIIVEPGRGSEPGGAHFSKDLSGVLDTRENLTLHVTTDLGPVHIIPLERGAPPIVRYSVHIETDARQPLAAQLLEHYVLSAKNTAAGVEITGSLPQQLARSSNSAQFWVHFEVTVPASYSVDVSTGAGDIETGDIGGAATLVTEGGNIVTGRLATNASDAWEKHGGHGTSHVSAKLQTQGGHIQVAGAAGDLNAFTAGGFINTGYIHGEASLHSGGGHIRSAGIGGKAELATEGGNITVGKAGNFVQVKTGGGQIDFGEVRGSVHAQTGGGGIRVMYVSGPMDVESSGGSICLTRVSGAVRNLAANIEAIVEHGGEHRIEADPALALQVTKLGPSNGPLKAMAALNGGGPVLKLKTSGGKIKLQYLESETALWDSMMRDQKARMERDLAMTPVAARAMDWPDPSPAPRVEPTPQPEAPSVWPRTWVNELEIRILGGVREDGDDFQKRITSAPRPAYPEIARKAGIEGRVRLQVRMTQDGRIEVQKLLEGDTVLADAAIAAVKRWRGKPVRMDGKPIDVISTVTFEFHLR
jgi:TonB family protein